MERSDGRSGSSTDARGSSSFRIQPPPGQPIYSGSRRGPSASAHSFPHRTALVTNSECSRHQVCVLSARLVTNPLRLPADLHSIIHINDCSIKRNDCDLLVAAMWLARVARFYLPDSLYSASPVGSLAPRDSAACKRWLLPGAADPLGSRA